MGDKIPPATYEIQLQAPDGEALSDIVALRVDRVDSDATKRDFVAVRAICVSGQKRYRLPACSQLRRHRFSRADAFGHGVLVLTETQLQIAFAPEEDNAWW